MSAKCLFVLVVAAPARWSWSRPLPRPALVIAPSSSLLGQSVPRSGWLIVFLFLFFVFIFTTHCPVGTSTWQPGNFGYKLPCPFLLLLTDMPQAGRGGRGKSVSETPPRWTGLQDACNMRNRVPTPPMQVGLSKSGEGGTCVPQRGVPFEEVSPPPSARERIYSTVHSARDDDDKSRGSSVSVDRCGSLLRLARHDYFPKRYFVQKPSLLSGRFIRLARHVPR